MQFVDKAMVRYNQYADTPKKKNYFEIAATLVLLIALIVMLYPAVTHIIELNKEIESGKLVSQSLQKKLSDLETAKSNLEIIKNDLPLLEIALPTGSDIKNYIQKPIETLSSANSLTIKSVQFNDLPVSKPEDASLNVRDMSFSLTLSGDFVNFNNFLKDFEKFIRVTNVSTVQIKSDGSAVTATLQANTNYLGSPITAVNQVGAK